MYGIVYNTPEGLRLRRIENNRLADPVGISDCEGIYRGLSFNVLEIVSVRVDVPETSVSLESLRRFALTATDGSPVVVDDIKLPHLMKYVKQYLP